MYVYPDTRLKLTLFWFSLPFICCCFWEIRAHKQTLRIKDDAKLKGQAKKKNQTNPKHTNSKVEFSQNLHPGWSFSKSLILVN